MFNVYGDGVFLDTVADNSRETLAQFHGLGYDEVEARPVGDLIEGDGVKEAESFYMPPPPAEIVFPEWMNDPAFLEEGKEMETLKKHGQAEIDMNAPEPAPDPEPKTEEAKA